MVSMFLSDGSVSLKSQNPAGGGSWIKTPPTVDSAANAFDVAEASARASRIGRPNVSTKACIASTPSALGLVAPYRLDRSGRRWQRHGHRRACQVLRTHTHLSRP